MWDVIDEKLGEIEGRPKGESIKKYSTDLTAQGRVSTTEDVGKVVGGFLCGPDSDFVTGQVSKRLAHMIIGSELTWYRTLLLTVVLSSLSHGSVLSALVLAHHGKDWNFSDQEEK